MNTNRYLEKIAGAKLDSAIRFADDVIGTSARRMRGEADVMAKMYAKGISPAKAQEMAEEAAKRTASARVKTGLGVAATGTAGFLGLHKYHQHKDNAILARIDSMYVDPNNQ